MSVIKVKAFHLHHLKDVENVKQEEVMAKIENLKSGGLNEADRLEIGMLLLKAGYTVKLGKEKPANSKTFNHFVEYLNANMEVANES